jgi:hypothetical protein
VTDENGVPATDVARQNVEVRLGKQLAPVMSVTRYHDAPIRIVIVLDESASMKPVWKLESAIVLGILKALPKNAAVGIITGNEKPGELLTSADAVARYLAVRSRPGEGPGGKTRLWDHVHEALGVLGGAPRPSDVILVISDGGDNISHISAEKLLKEIEAAGVRVSTAILIGDAPYTLEEMTGPEMLRTLLARSGGRNLTAPPFLEGGQYYMSGPNLVTKRSDDFVADFVSSLCNFYLVEAAPAQTLAKPVRLRVSVTDDNGSARKKLSVVTREQLGPGEKVPSAPQP